MSPTVKSVPLLIGFGEVVAPHSRKIVTHFLSFPILSASNNFDGLTHKSHFDFEISRIRG
jgi:hypothetical protein